MTSVDDYSQKQGGISYWKSHNCSRLSVKGNRSLLCILSMLSYIRDIREANGAWLISTLTRVISRLFYSTPSVLKCQPTSKISTRRYCFWCFSKFFELGYNHLPSLIPRTKTIVYWTNKALLWLSYWYL